MVKNKFILVFFGILLIGFVSSFSGNGQGTALSSYQITDCFQLQEMEDELDARYKLENAIDCSITFSWNSGKGFQPIGYSPLGTIFSGKLDGDGQTISGLYINRPLESKTCLFC